MATFQYMENGFTPQLLAFPIKYPNDHRQKLMAVTIIRCIRNSLLANQWQPSVIINNNWLPMNQHLLSTTEIKLSN